MTTTAPNDDLLWLIDRLADGAWHSGEALAAEAEQADVLVVGPRGSSGRSPPMQDSRLSSATTPS